MRTLGFARGIMVVTTLGLKAPQVPSELARTVVKLFPNERVTSESFRVILYRLLPTLEKRHIVKKIDRKIFLT